MQQQSTHDTFLNSSFSGLDAHDYEPFRKGRLDVNLPVPNSDIRLFIFNPADYPYLWVKYLEGLQRAYGRMGVSHILDMKELRNPDSAAMGILAIINGEIVAGLRFHPSQLKAKETYVYHEMQDGNQALLEQYLKEWLPEKMLEAKGLWLTTRHPARKRILHTMVRSSVYGAALFGARYIPCTSPSNMTKVYVEVGMEEMKEIGCVAYPTDDFKTSFGVFDLQQVFDNCTDQNRVLLRRDWQEIQKERLQSSQQRNNEDTWLPIILDEANPFHAHALESLLVSSEYRQKANLKVMHAELEELVPPVDEKLLAESKRWVAFPWRKTAIELIGPQSFKRLLRDRNRNKITAAEQEKLGALTVGVVGLSTGHVIAHTMVMEGVCGHIKLADFDTLEVSNLNRIPASLLDIGTNKAVATARKIAELDPYLAVEVFDDGLTEENINRFMSGLDVVVEECDSLDVKVLVREAAIARKIPVLMSTSDVGMMDIERFDLDVDPKPFHGLADVKAADLKDLSRRDKSGYALAIIEGEQVSARLAASMVEIDYTVSTWAQLASDVTQGAALVTTAVRRIGIGQPTPSSRTRSDMDVLLEQGGLPTPLNIDKNSEEDPVFTGDLKEDMALAAKFAPSPGNIQPWKINWLDETLNLEIDRALTTSMDLQWRGAMAALGAASLNAEIVASHHGVKYEIDHFPTNESNDLVTRVSLETADHNDELLQALYPYLLSRKTNRSLSERKSLSAKVMANLSVVTKHYPVKLHTLSQQEQLNDYAEISIESDRLRHLCQHLHQQMMGELVWPGKDTLEQGIDVRTLGLESKDLSVLPILERPDVMAELAKWNVGTALGDYNKNRIAAASAMVVLTISDMSDLGYVMGGKALQHFWLLAEQNGLSVQPISPIFLYANNEDDIQELMKGQYHDDVKDLQARFNELLKIGDTEYPVIVLKLSHASAPEYRSFRRN